MGYLKQLKRSIELIKAANSGFMYIAAINNKGDLVKVNPSSPVLRETYVVFANDPDVNALTENRLKCSELLRPFDTNVLNGVLMYALRSLHPQMDCAYKEIIQHETELDQLLELNAI